MIQNVDYEVPYLRKQVRTLAEVPSATKGLTCQGMIPMLIQGSLSVSLSLGRSWVYIHMVCACLAYDAFFFNCCCNAGGPLEPADCGYRAQAG